MSIARLVAMGARSNAAKILGQRGRQIRVRKVREVAGLETMRYHDLRHGAASMMTVLDTRPRSSVG